MARETKNDSGSQTARQRARQAMVGELERARKRQDSLAAVYTAIDGRKYADTLLGRALMSLNDLGVTRTDIAELSGLSSREVGSLIRIAEQTGRANGADSSDETAAPAVGETDHQEDTEHVA